ncbi:hypothetical protein NC992_21470 [Leptolyngbya subtilissima DQ-A4]|uniref:Phosphodiester glycosidase domain-containing protein n=2 Tax=Leptolyngbya TaxID=47251 RepID=A0ABV0K9M5_9CYAN|nr:hypothetical protein [Nodosilinea sp. FACHB-141]
MMAVLISWLLVAQGVMVTVNGSIPFSETARATIPQPSLGLVSNWATLPGFALLSQSLPVLGQDSIPHPPLLRHETSPAGNYHLILMLGKDEAGTQRTTASLFETLGDRCQQVWSHTLPHSYGPRLALVNDAGTVVLLDEWINVASPRAIVMMGLDGEVMAQHSFDDIVEVTGQSRAAVVDQAAQGFWLSGSPEMDLTGDRMTIPAAGGQLSLDLATGEMGF